MEKQHIFRGLLIILFVGVFALSLYLFKGGVSTDEHLVQSVAPISSVDTIMLESFPVQVRVIAKGSFVNSCWKLGGHEVVREGNRFNIKLSAFAPSPEMECTQVISDFEESISIDVYGLLAGVYTVSVNGIEAEFELSVDNVLQETTESSMDMYEGDVLAGGVSNFIVFNESDYQKALESDKTIFLYFYAKWCPTCKQEIRDAVVPAFDEYQSDDVVGFRVNYNDRDVDDVEEFLAKEYGVLYQHTKVFLKDGEILGVFPNSWTKEEYIEAFNQFSL